MPYEPAPSGCPAEDTDESPWEDAPSTTDTAHAEAEWTRLSSGFQNAGYREGITAGKEDALQEGFDAGFAHAGAPRGRELGLLRGLASAFLLHLSRSQAQLARTQPQDQIQTPTEEEGHDHQEKAAAAAKTAALLPAVREIVEALASVRFADIAPAPPPEEAEHVRAHGIEEGEKSGEGGMEGGEEVGRGPTGLSSSADSKATIEDVRALRVRLEALLCQVGFKVDLNFESLDP